ncbi:hypothetical protein SAMN05192555_10435 [Franzmannia pantelleriensis]|uniref:DUF3108 domain-containing protein n=1 Tax=Franzmannia pantelleriensis TaxID=48727 RepID=A0A1G9JH26_9GAMM|nr:hypothetical protein [Halomonas pantelleriensis]SDL36711.1 hypothetical protein SAMN05192555_10435 [Halomonas pantelleriensis]
MSSLRVLHVVLITSLLAGASASASAAQGLPEPTPFTAHYQLQISGWPNARVEHRLSQHGEQWQSDMRAAIAVARGNERSRFRVNADGVRPSAYSSGYSLLGIGGDYRLGSSELSSLPDRQAALFDLSRRSAVPGNCEGQEATPCELRFVDHKGERETLRYRVLERGQVESPAGTFDAVSVETWDPETPERLLVFDFHPDLPGLLLGVDYHRDGERRSRLTLNALETATP